MSKPTVHLVCNAHLDPVWQWRWEEGCAEAIATFGNTVELLRWHKELVFNHNEAVLYRWVQQYDPSLFRQVQKLVKEGRWCISGGWYLQPDVNIPGTESLIRQILVGRAFFQKHFGAEPNVAYNFDSFGHTGGLPQILLQAGYKMYIHMRPQDPDLKLPSDLYRWRGVDGSEILVHRISVGYYHSEFDNMEEKLREGTELALRLNRDVPVFWGIGNHGGGASREALETIDAFVRKERRVRIIHSTTEMVYAALKKYAESAPVVAGDLQRVFTGCYTSFSRVKRRAQRSLAEVVQAEALSALAWKYGKYKYPGPQLEEVWRDHLFNDFHDILPGSSTEPAELDALDQYGKVSETVRRLRLHAVSSFTSGKQRKLYIPVTIWNTNPSCSVVPVELECMIDLRPKWKGEWHLRLYTLDGEEIRCQEEEPESLLPFAWRRKISFMANLPHMGVSRYELRIHKGEKPQEKAPAFLKHSTDTRRGLITSLDAGGGRECLAGPMLQPIVIEDDGDSWGAGRWHYRNVAGVFQAKSDRHVTLESGPIRSIVQSVFHFAHSSIKMRTISYASWPILEYHLRINWAETAKRLKLSIPTTFRNEGVYCEVPGGAIIRPSDGEEHVHGRWCMLEGDINGRQTAFAIVNSGQHGFDFSNGEIRLSVLRSAAYCHDQGFKIIGPTARKYMDQGIHDVRLLVTAGDPDTVRNSLAGLADWLSAPPAVYAHLPISSNMQASEEFLSLEPQNVRLLTTKQSRDGKALVIRLQESAGVATTATLVLRGQKARTRLSFQPFEIKTIRVGKSGSTREVRLISES